MAQHWNNTYKTHYRNAYTIKHRNIYRIQDRNTCMTQHRNSYNNHSPDKRRQQIHCKIRNENRLSKKRKRLIFGNCGEKDTKSPDKIIFWKGKTSLINRENNHGAWIFCQTWILEAQFLRNRQFLPYRILNLLNPECNMLLDILEI